MSRTILSAKRPRSAREWHHYYLYQDPEFRAAIEKLRQHLEARYHEGVTFSIAQLKQLYGDDFKDEDKDALDELAAHFGTDNWGVEYFADGWHAKGYPFSPPHIDVQPDGDLIKITIDKHTTKKQLMAAWRWIDAVKGQRTKAKPPEYSELLYAVSRALRHGHTMREVFRLYVADNLPRYSSKAKPFDTADELEHYYRKYKRIFKRYP